uniref:Uncharacterized protein n=1 Tax=Arundo donax TaxID=35708 RepID=A0A0A8ZWJ9_ARUDO
MHASSSPLLISSLFLAVQEDFLSYFDVQLIYFN